MHAAFGPQQAKSVFALDFNRCTLDARHIAGCFIFNRRFEVLAFGVAQVFAQQHAGPVTGLGATGAGLDVNEAIVGVSLLAEHAAELKTLDGGCQ